MQQTCARSSIVSVEQWALPAKVRMDWEAVTGGKLVEGYGLSEASPVTHANPLNGDIRDGSVGLPIPCVDAMIMDQKTMEACTRWRRGRDHVERSEYHAGLLESPR